MITIGQRVLLLAVVVAGVLATAVYVLAGCPAQGQPAAPPQLPPPAPACTAHSAPCPPWAG